jgi:hypothetical protein
MFSTRARHCLLFLISGFCAALAARVGYGYALENKSWPTGTVITMQMELGTPAETLQDGSQTWNEAAVPALDDWNAETADVQIAAVMDSTKAVSSGDGLNSASFSSSVFGDSFGSGVLAVTYYRTQGSTMIEADVLFNNAQPFDSYRGDLQFNAQGKCICDIQRVFLNEMGHALGLNRPDGAGQHVDAIMNSVVSTENQLTGDDIAGIQSPDGASTFSPTPTPSGKPIARGIVNLLVKSNDLTGNPTLGLPYVDGERLKATWNTIQPDTTGNPVIDSQNYDWAEIDNSIALAAANGKYVGLSVGAGVFTPNWVYAGSPTVYKYFLDVADDDQTENGTEPFPWDLNYLPKWEAFLAAFGAKYDGNPTVRYVVMGGMQQFNQLFFIKTADASQSFNDGLTTGTTNLHSATANFVTGDVGKTISGVNIQEGSVVTARINSTDVTLDKTTLAGSGATFWIEERIIGAGDDFKINELAKHHPDGAAGSWPDYSDVDPVSGHLRHASTAAYISGTKRIIDAYHNAFPNTELILSAARPFPEENEYAEDTGDTVKLYGETLRPLLTGEMGTGLRAVPVPPPPTPTPRPATAPNGQQALHPSSFADIYAEPTPAPRPPPPQPLIDLMYNGWQKGVNYLELYQEDTTDSDPAAVAALQDMHTRLAAGFTPTPTPTPIPVTPSRLVNISTRMQVGTSDEVLIGGVIIQGSELKKVILRAIGPSLSNSGLTGALQDPQMELHDSTGALLDANDNWEQSLDSGEIIETGLAPSDPREAAIVIRLAPGNYTAIISGVNNTTGIGLVESYMLDTSASHAANISTRGRVGVGDDVLIGGFIVGGPTTKRIIVRALGPSLGGSGLAVLADPMVELHGSDGQLIAMNDDWASGSQQSEITATGLPPGNSREAALIATIPSGNYTAIVQGADGGAGIGLVEIYDLDL